MPAEGDQPPDCMQDFYEAERQWLTPRAAFPSPRVSPVLARVAVEIGLLPGVPGFLKPP
jgi:hypothetical protein